MAIYELEPRVLFDGAAAVATAEAVVAEMQTHDANAADSADSNSGDADSQNSSSDTQTPNPDSSTPATDSSQPSTDSSTDQTQIFIDTIIGTYDATTDGENILATPDNSELLSTDSGISDLQSSHEVVFIDALVKDADTIVASLDQNAEVVYLDSSESGIAQITDYLSTHEDISSVQIVSEGNYAQIMLGSDVVTADNIENYKDAISSWQSHLTADADILFYGCDIAKDSAGQGVLNDIANWTGADVAASTDTTGVQGDWDLEFATGAIEAHSISAHDYHHNLETYTVTAITDSGDTSVTGTLSWAIDSSNATTSVDDTIAFNLTSGDTVTINGSETYENVLPIITDSVTIDGTNIATGNDVTVQVATPGSSFFRVFEINASGETVNIENMTIKGGGISDDGGGILIDAGTVNLDHVVVSNSTAGRGGGIYNAGTLTVTNSTISDNSALDYYYHEGGGGIYNAGTLTVITSTISGNSTTNASILDTGGGIYNKGTLTITDSTISDNSTTGCGAGIYNYNGATATITSSTISGNTAHEDGGGIANYGTLILTSSTISGNSATYDLGGGIYNYNGATATITSCTINGNSAYGGGGIANEGTTLLANTIIINNTATSSGGDIATSGTLNAYYCWYDASTTYGSITSSVGCTTTAYDSSLSSLADNGGYTMTMAASSSSTALNAGCWIGSYTSGSDTKYAYSTDGSTWYALEDGSSVSETVTQITTDQRGYYINSNVGISIGAYQYDGLVAKIGSATSWTTGVLGTDVFTTIQSAVNVASDTIYLAATSIMLSSTEVYLGGIIINSSVTLTGENGDSSSTIVRVPTPGSGGTASRVFYISVGTSTIENMTIQGGDISGESVAKDGGSIYIEAGTLNLDNVEISGANADSGGGIYIAGGTLTITDSTISNNSATHKGGGIYNAGTLTVINSTISGNATMGDNGGGIYNSNGTLTITSSTISDNEAGGDGGGIFNNASAIANITSSTISDNEASTNGGGIFNDGKLTITDSTISGNSSVSYGGGIFNDAVSIANITSSTISNNSSSSSGGGGIFNDGELTITDSTISGNTAATYGGGIYNYIGTVYVTNSIIAYNYKGTTGSYAYSDIYNLNGTIYGNYNISGYDLTAVGSGNQLYTYTSGKGDSLFASYTTIEADSIYVPVLADNGGNTYTVALASDSIAIGTGCYTGTYTSGSDTKYAYSADGNTWHAVEDGSSVTDTVTQITTDQRGETITGSPSIGAYFEQEPYYYFKSTASGGAWSAASTWTRSTTEEGVYTAATNAPTLYNSYSVTVVDGSTVTITSDVSITNLTVDGDLTLDATGTLDIIDAGAEFTVNGILDMAGGMLTLSLGEMSYGNSSTLIYSASTAQNTSVELPSTGVANVIIDNSNGVTLTSNVSSISGDLTISSGTLQGAYSFTVDGNATINGAIGSTTALTSFTVNGTSSIGGDITTTGLQTYTGAVTLTADVELSSYEITFNSTINGTSSGTEGLTVNTSASAFFEGAIGTTPGNELEYLTVSNIQTYIYADITTTLTQTYSGAVILNSNLDLTGTTVIFNSTLNSNPSQSLTVTGDAQFNGAVGHIRSLSALSVSGTSSIGADITTTGTQTYNGAVTLTSDATLSVSTATFSSTVDGTYALTVTGKAAFAGNVGTTANLSSLSVSETSSVGANITTTGVQTYTGAVTLTDDAALTASTATFSSTVNGTHSLTVTGDATVNGAIGATSALTSVSISGTTNVGADITTTGAQSYTQTITLTNDITVKSGSGTITFTGSVQGNYTLDIGSTTQTGAIVFSSDVTITGLQTHSGAYSVSLLGNSSIDNAVTFSNTNGVVLGNASTDTLTFTSGVTSIVSTTSVAGTITASNGSTIQLGTTNVTDDATIGCNIVLGNVTIADGATLTLGDGDSGNITVASISGTSGGASSDIIINTLGVLTLGKVSTDIYNLSITVGSTSEITDDVIITGTLSKLGTGELKLQSDDMVAGKISLTGGTLTGGDYDWTISEDVTIGSGTTLNAPAILYVTGNWNNSGTFNHNNGEVRFEGDGTTSTISGANTFYDLSCEHVNDKTLTFTITDLQTVESWFTILGGDHQANAVKINNLYSSVNDYSVAFATVSGSNSLNKTIIASFSNNGGGNYNWRFEDFYEWDGSSDGDWNNPDNWTGPGGTPTSTSDVLINTQTGGYTLDISTAIIVEDFAILPGTSVNFTSNDGSITCNYVGGESVGFVNLGTVASDSGITVTLAVTGSDTVAMYSGIINSGGGISLTSTSVYLSDNISTTNYDISINANTAILRADVALSSSGGNITLSGTVLGNNHSLTIDAGTGDASLPTFSDTNRILNLSVTAGNNSTTITNNVYTDGTQTYTGHVVIGADVILDADDSDISFSGTVDADANTSNRTLTLDSGTGNITFSDAIGAAQAIDTLTITNAGAVSLAAVNTRDGGVIFTNAATGTITLNGNISTNEESTAGAVTIKGAVVLAADITIDTDSTTDGAISFTGTIDGAIAGQEYLVISGNTVFSSTIGATTSLEYLTVGGTSSIGGNVTTTGIQTYTGAVTLTNDGNTTTFATTNSAITFTGGITDGTSTVGLTVNSGSANTVISSTVTIDGTLTKEGSGNFVTNGNDITTGGLTVNAGVFNSGNSSGTWDINGDVSIASGATLNATSGTFTVSGSWGNSGTFDANGTTVTFDGSADQTISGTNTFYNLTIANTGDPSSIEVDASGSTSLAVTNNLLVSDGKFISATDYNNVSIASGAFLVLSGDITVSGNWSNSGTFTPGTYTVTLDGADQEISAETFYSLVSNGAGLKTLTGDVTIENALTLASGIFVLGSYNMTLQFTGNISGTGSSTNMIVTSGSGSLIKRISGNGTYVFPLGSLDGSTGEYSPITIELTSGTYNSTYLNISVVPEKDPNNTNTDNYINRYWIVDSSGISNFTADITCQYLFGDVVGTEGRMKGELYSDSSWTDLNAVDTITHTFTGSVTSFGDFTAFIPKVRVSPINDATIISVIDDSTGEPSNSSSHPTYNFGVVTLNGIEISGNATQLNEDSTSANFAKEDIFNPDTENVYDHKVDKPLNFDRTLMNDTSYDDDTVTGEEDEGQGESETAMIFEQTNDYLAMIAGMSDGESLYSVTLDKHALFKTSTDIYLDAIVSGQV